MGFSSSKQSSNQQSTSSSNSNNQAYPFLQNAFGAQTGYAASGNNAIASLLGLNGDTGQNQAFENFKNSSGYNFIRDEGMKGINANNASRGLLGSGSALKALTGYNSNLANSFLNSYIGNLFNLSNAGLGAGQLLSSAGNTAQSQSNSFGTSRGKSTSLSSG